MILGVKKGFYWCSSGAYSITVTVIGRHPNDTTTYDYNYDILQKSAK